MASISKDPNGNVCLQFVGGDKRRRTIRLGKVNQKTAEAVKLKVEHLHNANVSRTPLNPDTARWVASIADDLAAKLAAVGLIPERVSNAPTTAAFLTDWLAGKRAAGFKPTSLIAWGQTVAELTELFGPRPCPPSPTPTAKRSATT